MHGAARIQPAGRRLKLWWARGQGEADPLAGPSSDRPINLFEPKSRDQMFTAGGLFTPSGEIDEPERDDLHRMMAALSLRMAADHPASREDNPHVPAGYTYFLQFIAHDMVDTVLWPSVARSADLDESRLRVQMRNGRAIPLTLATLYGPGPDALPAAYEFGERQRLRHGHIPRLRFRLGPKSGNAPATDGFCPHRDIARARTEPDLVCDRGLPERLRPAPGESPRGRPYLTEALVADPRNDSHPLISQFTVLFKLLHNQIVSILENELKKSARERSSGEPDDERVEAYRLFQCARSLTTIIYHGIVATDLMPRIVDRRVLDRYNERGDAPFGELRGAPLEFSFGAFRFAHSLIRDSYRVNRDNSPQHMINGLSFSSSRRPAILPLTGFWMVDWSLFFDLDDGRLENFSKCISPLYPRALTHEDHFMPKDKAVDAIGVADRDMLSSSYAGLLSVPAIVAELSGRFNFIEPFETITNGLKEWLRKPGHWRDAPGHDMKTYLDRLTSDPPLPFFILYEAQHALAPVPLDERRPGDPESRKIGGRRLGPVGSAILCETIFSAMRRAAPVEVTASDVTRNGDDREPSRGAADQKTMARYRACLNGFYSDSGLIRGVVDSLPAMSSMPQLIEFLKAAQMDEGLSG